MRGGRADCAGLGTAHASPSTPAGNALVDRLDWSSVATTFSVFNEVWTFAIDARTAAAYRAIVVRAGARAPALPAIAGLLRGEHPRVLHFVEARLPRGVYRIEVTVTARGRPRRTVTLRSPAFGVR